MAAGGGGGGRLCAGRRKVGTLWDLGNNSWTGERWI